MPEEPSRIMVVDDESIVAMQMEEFLKLLGYNVIGIASSGEEAVVMARRLLPDLILMDIVMPGKELDGIAASEIIKDELDIPIVFMTAYGGEQIIDRAKQVQPLGIIIKPFQKNELKASIEVAIHRKRMEDQLKESEEKYRSVFKYASDTILILDINSNIISWNEAAKTLYGYSDDELLNKPFISLFPERLARNIQNEMHRIVLIGKSEFLGKVVEYMGIHKEGTEFPMEFAITSWKTRAGIFFTIIARDITERKKMEQLKTDFISLVSHQLKTPVAEIKEFVVVMLSGLTGELTDMQRKFLEEMHRISHGNYRLVSDLLNVSRIERGVISFDVKSIQLQEIIKSIVQKHQKAIKDKGLKLLLKEKDNHQTILADKDKLIEALSNIVNNAIKFTENGSITIETKTNNSFGIIEISDTGPGIHHDYLDKLFTRDQILSGAPSSEGGCGLGLYIAKRFLTLQKGDITVETKFGQGSRFIVEVPLESTVNTKGDKDE